MEKSAPAPAAPEETTAQEEKPRRDRRRIRVPSSVLVTLFVALLSVWVAPALTRQWDDRQKARELKAAIAEEMITSWTKPLAARHQYAQLFLADRAITETRREQIFLSVDADWRIAYQRIAAKLAVYFPGQLETDWNQYGSAVATYIGTIYYPLEKSDIDRIVPWDKRRASKLKRADSRFPVGASLEIAIRDRGEDLVRRTTRTSPRDFSTTRGDLMRDILPGI
jgi:hypothetical protein